jgi:hypothetical protein
LPKNARFQGVFQTCTKNIPLYLSEMPKESKKDTKVSKRADDGKKRRAKKDPSAPKRGLSAYMFFSQAHRKTVQEENPEAGFGMCTRLI